MEYKNNDALYVITRTGIKEELDPSKITERIKKLANRKPTIIDFRPHEIMLKVCEKLIDNISTSEIDELTGTAAVSLALNNPRYLDIAARIVCDNHHKNTDRSFLDKMKKAYFRKDKDTNKIIPLLSETYFKYVQEHYEAIEAMIDYSRDFNLSYFGIKTFQKIYGIRIDNIVIERPQDMFMRTAIALHMKTIKHCGYNETEHSEDASNMQIIEELKLIKETYEALSCKQYTQASPTYFNAGSVNSQFSSCFVLGSHDSVEGIMDTAKHSAIISKFSGGIGLHVHAWRSRGVIIRGTNGESNGIVPFLRIMNNNMLAFNQGGKRLGSTAVYLSPHHPDFIDFVKLRLHAGNEEERARDLFYSAWIPDIFMERVRDDMLWSMFDPNETIDLSNYYGDDYRKIYLELEQNGRYRKQVKAREIWNLIYESNKQTGMPYLCFSDNVNKSSMHNNIGVIKASNLCTEIEIYSSEQEYGTCNLCSINLAACVKNKSFDFERLIAIARMAVVNLNNLIDKNKYPVEESRRSNMRHRPIGIGVQGLADVYLMLKFPFESNEARLLNKQIFETIYYAAVSQSTIMCRNEYKQLISDCKINGSVDVISYNMGNYDTKITTYNKWEDIPKNIAAYPSMYWKNPNTKNESNISKGIFHWELTEPKPILTMNFDWESIREHIKIYGIKNSLLIALMPTASTSQLLGNNECIEPYTSNVYKRKTLAGEFIVINKHLAEDLYRLNMYNPTIRDYLIASEGSVQHIIGLPDELKQLYKTAYEIDQKELINQAADRQPFIDQSQSLNWYVHNLNGKLFTDLAFHAWKKGLKTGKYYLHSKPAAVAMKFSIDPALQAELAAKLAAESSKYITQELPEGCLVCGS